MNRPQEVELTFEPLTLWRNNVKLFPTFCCLFAIVLTSVGCSSLKSDGNGWNPLKPNSTPKNGQATAQPVSMAVVWKDSVYEQPGVPSIKGFGGRFFIYDGRNNPVEVDGELIVYGYDESNPIHSDGSHTGADKKFVFPRETLQRHFSQSDLGPSYSVWIPWEQVGGVRKSITLIPVFKTTEGNVLRCGHSLVVLPGRTPKTEPANISGIDSNDSPNLVAQASFQQIPANKRNNHISQVSANTDITTSPTGLRTTTFSVPQSLAQKLTAKQTLPKPALPMPPSQNEFPRPEASAEPNDKLPIDSGSSNKIKSPATKTTRPTPKVFGMPGSF